MQLSIIVAKYASCYSYITLHLKGEEVFKSHKWFVNLPLGSKGDLHKHDHVNIFYLQIDTTSTCITTQLDVDGGPPIGESRVETHVLIHKVEKYVNVVVDMLFCILSDVPTSSIMQKNTNHNYKVKIMWTKSIINVLLHVVMVFAIISKMVLKSLIDFGFVMTTSTILWEVEEINMWLISPMCLLYGWSNKGQISSTSSNNAKISLFCFFAKN